MYTPKVGKHCCAQFLGSDRATTISALVLQSLLQQGKRTKVHKNAMIKPTNQKV